MKTEKEILEELRKNKLHRDEALKRIGQIIAGKSIEGYQFSIETTREVYDLKANIKSYNNDIELLEWVLRDDPSVEDI